tara:strand:+ start:368 stop:748 length:381 start_codon:yes stop_codon:yes gene_type:complete
MKSNTNFGIFLSSILIGLTIYFYIVKSIELFVIMLLMSLIIIFVTTFFTDKLTSVKNLWIKLGYLIGLFVSPIILGIIFYLIITPTAIITKIFGRDLLNLKKIKKDTYWINRENSKIEEERFKKQY